MNIMNSIEFLKRLTGIISELPAEGMLLPMRINGKEVAGLSFGVHCNNDEVDYINLIIND